MKSILSVRGLSFELPNGRPLFTHVNFNLSTQRTALVGPNGVGKTVLAKILGGELEPSSGEVLRTGAVSVFSQREIPKRISAQEYLFEKYSWSELGERLLEGIDLNTFCTDLSGGQWMRVRLARALDESFLILDEPTNDLDREGREALLHFLRNSHQGLLLISHDRECLGVCDEVLELSNRGLTKYGFGWSEYTNARREEREGLQKTLAVAKKARSSAALHREEQVLRQEKRNRRGSEMAARGGVPKILLGARKRNAEATTGKKDAETLARAEQSVRETHQALEEIKTDPTMYADLEGQSLPAQKLVAEAEGFNIHFAEWLFKEDLRFSWRGSVRLAIRGANGSGKSTLLKCLMGGSFSTRGEFRRGTLTTLYVDQRCAMLDEGKSIFENVRDHSDYSETEIRNGLAKFLFTKESVFQKVSTLSGGERLRVALACGFLRAAQPELLVLDEPTNNLDLPNIEFLENLVRRFKGALVVVSHDEVFLQNCELTEEFAV